MEYFHIMNVAFEHTSIVIIAKDFNPSIFKPLWLAKNNILREEELQGDVVITPPAIQIPTKAFQFSVLPDRLQMIIPQSYSDAESDIIRVLGGIIKTLPHTPYTAVGINFNYVAAPSAEDTFAAWNRKLFASAISKKLQSPKAVNARLTLPSKIVSWQVKYHKSINISYL